MARLFLAVELPPPMHTALDRLIKKLTPRALSAKWVSEKNAHLTLEFLGDFSEEKLAALHEAMEQVSKRHCSFGLHLLGGGSFGAPQSPRVLWVNVQGDTQALHALQVDVQNALKALGHVPEKRAFRPHLTLARSKSPQGDPSFLKCEKDLQACDLGTLNVTSFVLFQSELKPEGALHVALEVFSLSEGP